MRLRILQCNEYCVLYKESSKALHNFLGVLPLTAVLICLDGVGTFLANFTATSREGGGFKECATNGRLLNTKCVADREQKVKICTDQYLPSGLMWYEILSPGNLSNNLYCHMVM